MEDLRFPIGKFEWVPPQNEAEMSKRRAQYIEVSGAIAGELRQGCARSNAGATRNALQAGGLDRAPADRSRSR